MTEGHSVKRPYGSAPHMSVTAYVAQVNEAVRETARTRDITGADVRVLLAVGDRNGISSSDILERDLLMEGSGIRRSTAALRPEFITGGDQRGRRTPIVLTDAGWAVVGEVRRRLAEITTNQTNQEDNEK
jgi:hypothetical protein